MDAPQYGEEAGTENMKQLTNIDPAVFASRKRVNKIGLALSMGAMIIGMLFLFWILGILFYKGFSAVHLSMFIESTPAPGSDGGGLANAIVGTLVLVGIACCIGLPDRKSVV